MARDDASRPTDADVDAESDAGQGALLALHAEVDREAGVLAGRHAARLHCGRGCSACCADELRVYDIEAERIRRAHPRLLAEGLPHPHGACAFLDEEGACRVYADRPYVCRTQGLPLRILSEDLGGEIQEHRDICPLNAEGTPLSQLPEDDCWLIGPREDRLARLQHARDGDRGERVALRSLFARSG